MKASEFKMLVGHTNLQPGKTLDALRLHLVEGLSMPDACKRAGNVARQAVYVALKKLPREKCPACRQWLPPGTKLRKR